MKNKLLSGNGELSFMLEGKFTNLRVWGGHDGNGRLPIDTIFMRLDHAKQTSMPWGTKAISHLKKLKYPELEKFSFKTPLSKIDELIEILKQMIPRECIEW